MATSTDAVDLVGDETVENVARTALFAALTGAGAYVAFPFPGSPVPVTLQVLFVFLAGLMLGPRWGTAAMVVYLVAGAVGAPVFQSGNAGLGYLLGAPTAGYLWAYPLAAAAVGVLVHGTSEIRDPSDVELPRVVVGLAAGAVVVYAGGVAWLVAVGGLGVGEAVTVGVVPFVVPEVLKGAAAVGIVRSDQIVAT